MSALIAIVTLMVCVKADNEIVSLIALCIASLWGVYKLIEEREKTR